MVDDAIKRLDEFTVRRINLPINKKVEEQMLKENGIEGSAKIQRFFSQILKGEIHGRKDLVYC